MKGLKGMQRRFLVTAGCFFLISLSLLFLPISTASHKEGLTAAGVLTGVLFWAGLVSGCISYFLMYRKYKKVLIKELPKSRVLAPLRFFCNRAAIAVDAVLMLSIAGVIYCSVAVRASRILEFVSLFLLITSLYLHFLVTGRIFQYLVQRKKGVKET